MRVLAIPLIAVLAAAPTQCSEEQKAQLIKERIVVVRPDSSWYVCPTSQQLTSMGIDNYTEADVVRIINQLERNNRICASSLVAIRSYLDRAAADAEKRNKARGL